MAAAQITDPSTESSAYCRMKRVWKVIDDILAGPETIRCATIAYLPKYSSEGDTEYKRRLAQAPWRPEFADILQSLASKPFGKEIELGDKTSEPVKALTEDVDQRGNDLTAFSRGIFRGGIAKGMHAILVDYPTLSEVKTAAEEKRAGARPYWVSIRAEDIIALYTEFVNGREIVAHVRIKEVATVRDGFGEKTVKRVRVLEPGRWELWEATGQTVGGQEAYAKVGEGVVTLGIVPLALFWTGEREGGQFVRPPLASLANMQIELYRALSRQDEILTYAGSPMLQAKGMMPPDGGETIEVGPKRVLFSPPGIEGAETGWSYIQPDADNLTEIRESVKKVEEDIRRLGMQPLTQQSGGVTATASSIEGAKAHSTVEAWALGLKDVLEQALMFTAMWLGETEGAEVTVDTDFSVQPYAQAPLDALDKARERGDISQRTYWNGLRRFDVLAPDFDADAEEMDLAAEEALKPDPAPTQIVDPALAA